MKDNPSRYEAAAGAVKADVERTGADTMGIDNLVIGILRDCHDSEKPGSEITLATLRDRILDRVMFWAVDYQAVDFDEAEKEPETD
ncbi:hypothetical protein HII28_09510 [Planctomonas sp. JC2975]|uniref:hypothetical protein n=1 Tax=Planctomonas sp. JC2975 TaxID=2729626 RepID=UPI001475F006|nr:hypothetical protein [Planctomonas sp. JC2975]NNC12113.1 hypothetical protein [Planctomonas sp. JC2975]